jgi:hypothetical protein
VTGRHQNPDAVMDEIEADGLRVKAAALAGQMTDWLAEPESGPLVFGCLYEALVKPQLVGHDVPAELVEWCRSARDILEAVARG